jgi:hypothetical protein
MDSLELSTRHQDESHEQAFLLCMRRHDLTVRTDFRLSRIRCGCKVVLPVSSQRSAWDGSVCISLAEEILCTVGLGAVLSEFCLLSRINTDGSQDARIAADQAGKETDSERTRTAGPDCFNAGLTLKVDDTSCMWYEVNSRKACESTIGAAAVAVGGSVKTFVLLEAAANAATASRLVKEMGDTRVHTCRLKNHGCSLRGLMAGPEPLRRSGV